MQTIMTHQKMPRPYIVDTHTHTEHSYDGSTSAENFIRAAIARGISHLCITDHSETFVNKDLKIYQQRAMFYVNDILELKKKYRDKIYVSAGLECNWSRFDEPLNKEMFEKIEQDKHFPFEYILNSFHDVFGSREKGIKKDNLCSCERYYQNVSQSLDAPYHFHAVGHINFISRYIDKCDCGNDFSKYNPVFDEILKKIIKRGVILELNTSTKPGHFPTIPDINILKKYREFGGTMICPASDAHIKEHIGRNYNLAKEIAKKANFEYWTIIQNGQSLKVRF
ncbi:MAG: histidinol-phosphatase HisJ family protein [Firmicutes bacterium]|nr:histidinol-phosphatase HisJ family protein [Bacillota bacterium]